MSKVLLVDDDEFVREYVKAYLTEWGHSVIEADRGEAAVEKARQEQPEIVVMDINMPGLTGFETIEKLREDSVTRSIAIVALSSNDTAGDRDQAYELGCAAYVVKPIVDTDLLRIALERALGATGR